MNKFEEVSKACEPLIEYLRDNYDPHTHVVVSSDSVKVLRDELGIPIEVND